MEALERNGRIKVARVKPVAAAAANLDVGEASILSLAIEYSGMTLVLMDETIGGSYARAHSLKVTGLVGVLMAAKRVGLVPSVRPFLEPACRKANTGCPKSSLSRSSKTAENPNT